MTNAAAVDSPLNNGANATVSANIKAEIARSGITQGSLAHEVHMTEMSLSRRLNGSTEFSSNEIQAIADYFGMMPGELFVQQKRRPTGGGRNLHGVTPIRPRALGMVGPEGYDPPTSTVESRDLAPVLPFKRKAV